MSIKERFFQAAELTLDILADYPYAIAFAVAFGGIFSVLTLNSVGSDSIAALANEAKKDPFARAVVVKYLKENPRPSYFSMYMMEHTVRDILAEREAAKQVANLERGLPE